MTTNRANSLYTNGQIRVVDRRRTQRSIDSLKQDVEDLETSVAAIGGFTSLSSSNFDIDGTTSEDIAAPTAGGAVLIRVSNKVTAAGTHTLNFLTTDALKVGSSTVASQATSGAGSVLFAISEKYLDSYRWIIITYYGFS